MQRRHRCPSLSSKLVRFAADLIGLPLPPLYSEFQPDDSVVQSEHGINFAVGGSGVTYAWGFIPLGTQVDSFEILANMGIYSPEILASSVALVSEVGNDYASFVGNAMVWHWIFTFVQKALCFHWVSDHQRFVKEHHQQRDSWTREVIVEFYQKPFEYVKVVFNMFGSWSLEGDKTVCIGH